jgi:hypothetical protein
MSQDGRFDKVEFFLEVKENGRFRAVAPGCAEAVGQTLNELRSNIRAALRVRFGVERPYAILVGVAGDRIGPKRAGGAEPEPVLLEVEGGG